MTVFIKHARSITILAITLYAAPAMAETPAVTAPYGLTWKQPKSAVEALGVVLTGCEQQEDTMVCDAKTLPVPAEHVSVDFYRVRFDQDGLVAVSLASSTIPADPDGSTGKVIYEAVRKDIVALYGEGVRTEKVGKIMPYVLPTEFYECLDFDGCGDWRTEWADGYVVLSLKGLHPGEGYVMANFYRPS